MTNSIGSLPAGQPAADLSAPPVSGSAAKPAGGGTAGATASGEAVTVSADAQTTAQLLDAARQADGVDQARVSQLKDAVQAGTYGVSPQDLAKAIAGAAVTPGPAAGRQV